MVERIEEFKKINRLESPIFAQQELDSIGLYVHMKGLGIWEKMEKISTPPILPFGCIMLPKEPEINILLSSQKR